MKMVSIDDTIDYCDAEIPHLHANKQTVALCALRRVKEAVKEYMVEAEPVKHGQWHLDEHADCRCSLCNTKCLRDDVGINITSNYCPTCGAKMDEE